MASHESQMNEEDKNQKKFMKVGVGLAAGSLLYPIQHVKILIQLGHEPLALKKDNIFLGFGSERFWLPNALSYGSHIYKNHGGFSGLYTGFGCWALGTTVGCLTSLHMADYIDDKMPEQPQDLPNDNDTEQQLFIKMLKRTTRDAATKSFGIMCARPFQVIMIRRIAQAIGGEDTYPGLVPQLLGELAVLYTCSSALHVLDRAMKKYYPTEEPAAQGGDQSVEQTFRKVASVALPYVVNSLFYPLQLVSTVMAVNGTSLAAGCEPHIPVFFSWKDCYNYLSLRNEHKRGASIFFRRYDGPVTYKGGAEYAMMKYKDYRMQI